VSPADRDVVDADVRDPVPRSVPSSSFEPSFLDLFDRTVADMEGFLADQDVIYVGGGNTANLLAVWRVHGLDGALRAAWEAGVVLHALIAAGTLPPGIACDDFAAAHFAGTELHEAVASREGAGAYRLQPRASRDAVEEPIPTRRLSG
jgi:peptidase E